MKREYTIQNFLFLSLFVNQSPGKLWKISGNLITIVDSTQQLQDIVNSKDRPGFQQFRCTMYAYMYKHLKK